MGAKASQPQNAGPKRSQAFAAQMGKGRPKGAVNRNTAQLKDMILTALSDAGGVEYLKRQANENPGPFLALVGKVLPMTIAGDPNAPLKVVRVELVGE